MNIKDRTIAVTGATGFLGRYIVDALASRGAKVVGVVRNPDKVPELSARGVELRRADLANRIALATGFQGADAIVSNAALFSLTNTSWAAHESANLQGTENVLEAAATARVPRVVHVSSVAVYGLAFGRFDENSPQLSGDTPRRPWNTYSVSKALSEQIAWSAAARLHLSLTTVRPCTIFGAFDPNFTPIVRTLLRSPISLWPGRLQLPLVYAGDVAEAICGALENEASSGQAYNVCGDPLSLEDFRRAWAEASRQRPWMAIPVPISGRVEFDTSKARSDLGFQNRPYVAALRDTFEREASAHK